MVTHGFRVERELYLPAPEGDAVYVHGPGYAADDGVTLLETVRHEALHFKPDGGRHYYSRRIYRRRSDDNGRTWRETGDLFCGNPERLAGRHVYPGAILRFPGTGILAAYEVEYELDPAQPMFGIGNRMSRTYVLGNFLAKPVHGQVPRYPLCIAELDTDRAVVRRATVRVIQDLPAGAPTDRRYTNWGQYEERGSRDLVLLLPEQPKHMNYEEMRRPEDFTADCIRIRVRLGV